MEFVLWDQLLEVPVKSGIRYDLTPRYARLRIMTGSQSPAREQLPDFIKRLTQQTVKLEIQQETKKTFWDTWPFFLMLVGLLSLDWYLRKRWGLV